MWIESYPTPIPAPARAYSPPRGRAVPGYPALRVQWVRSLTVPHGLGVLIREAGRPDRHEGLDALNATAAGAGRAAAEARAILRAVEGA